MPGQPMAIDDGDADRTVGIIGIGLLGSAIADRLLAAGLSVWGCDTSAEAQHAFAAKGGISVLRPGDIPVAAHPIVLCLPNSDVVEQVLVDMIPRLKPGTTLIDTTTGESDRTIEMAERLAVADVDFLDASVLGSSDVTRAGNAVLMVGSAPEPFQRVSHVLNAISANVMHVGPVGSGQQVKLVANLVLGLNRAALAEGLSFAKSLGLDLNLVLDVLKSGAAYSTVMDAKGRKMIDEDFEPQARLSQHLKDVRLMLKLATASDTNLPLSLLHQQLLESAESAGHGDLDNSAIIRAWGRDGPPADAG
ncbi:MAG TPA: NAD(P)-dependent oxidoreductase [Planctomycetes bacterium]|nr:NAD(P)-dependent oxidoreductase [Fuerstiella sp.]HIK91060.1 NAD(P)-dependent oxidoreductase [Planctomycetota bacterium]